MKIGVAITTTPERFSQFLMTRDNWMMNLPAGTPIVSCQDIQRLGVAYAKNECLRILEEQGVTDYFLADDDTYPISKDWWKPFVESEENHLLYNFKLKGKPPSDMKVLYQDDKIISYSHTRGCFIYVTQKVLDTVGGFDERFYNSLEHPDYTTRIHNAGLTSHRSMSPVGVEKLIYCLDQDGLIESSIKESRPDYRLYRANKLSKEYMRYK